LDARERVRERVKEGRIKKAARVPTSGPIDPTLGYPARGPAS